MSTRAARLCAGCVLVWLCAFGSAKAHPTPGSVAFIDFTVDGARIEQDVPIEELERALKRPVFVQGESAERCVARQAAALGDYALLHLRATTVPGERSWKAELLDVAGHDSPDGPRARFRFVLRAPSGDTAASLHLHDEIVAHEVISHYTLVYVRSDWASGDVTERPWLVGTIHAGRNDLSVARHGSFWRGLRGIVALGMEHIATGTDHLLFLFALVLVAPVAVSGGRWQRRRDTPETLLALAAVVSAFSVGHSSTLALGVLGGALLPGPVVEAAIALSILVAASHALHPLFPRREALLAGAFGLVHGLAFASSLAQRDLGRVQTLWTLLGFNIGIELAQLGLLSLVLPWLLILARTRAYAAFRVGGALVAALLACAWLLERTLGVSNPAARPVAWLEAHPLSLLVCLASSALLARAADRSPSVLRLGRFRP